MLISLLLLFATNIEINNLFNSWVNNFEYMSLISLSRSGTIFIKDQIVNIGQPPSSSKNFFEMLTPLLGPIVSILTAFILWFNVKKQIKAAEYTLLVQMAKDDIKLFREAAAEYLVQIELLKSEQIQTQAHFQQEILLLEKKLILMLDVNDPNEKELINLILKHLSEKIVNVPNWIKEMQTKINEVITSKLNSHKNVRRSY